MKRLSGVAIGFIAGAMCMVTATAFASSYQSVEALLFHDVMFTVDGEKMASPSDQPVLNYNGYTYVPVRYMTEVMGGTIEWDVVTKNISVETDKKTYIKEVEVEKIIYVESGEVSEDNIVYTTLPTEQKKNLVTVGITGLYRDTVLHTTKFFVEVENGSTNKLQLVPGSAELIVDGVEVSSYALVQSWDSGWETSDIKADDEREGYLIFDLIDEDYSTIQLSVDVRNSESEITTYTFYFKNN